MAKLHLSLIKTCHFAVNILDAQVPQWLHSKGFTCCLKSIYTQEPWITGDSTVTMTTQVINHARYRWSCLRAVLLALRFLVVLLFALARAFFALAAAGLLLALGQGLKAPQEIIFPRLEVGLDTAVSALHHVTVTFSAAHDARRAQHPQPLVHVFANLEMDLV